MADFLGNITILLGLLGYLLTLVLIPWILLTKKRHPTSRVAWVMIVIVLPFVGGLLFLVFGINRVQRRMAGKQQASRAIAGNLPALSEYHLIPGEALNSRQQRLMRLAHRVAETRATVGNKVEILADTNRTLGLIEQSVLVAKESLHLEYYIWQPDHSGTRLRNLLIKKAREGLAVRFLYDNIGSMRLSKRFLKPMRDAGIQVATFLPETTFRERWSLNLRNHRKIVIVDGKIGFTGE